MKKCSFCAEDIQDDAVKCRYCGSDLRPGAVAQPNQDVTFSHTGVRFLLGHGADFFGIWDRQSPGPPIERFPRNQPGWEAAWNRYQMLEQSRPVATLTVHASPPTNGLAVASLVLGILWLYWIGSILALIFGYSAKSAIDRSGGQQGGRGLAVAGIVLGWVGIGTLILAAILWASAVNEFSSF